MVDTRPRRQRSRALRPLVLPLTDLLGAGVPQRDLDTVVDLEHQREHSGDFVEFPKVILNS